MAMWITHLRLVDQLLGYGFDLMPLPFYAGSVASDAGFVGADGHWTPDKKLTHFRDDINGRMQPEDFYAAYIHQQTHDAATYAFLMGYYAHLLADVEWIGNVWRPLKYEHQQVARRMEIDADFAYTFKRDNYFAHDLQFLQEHPEYVPLQALRQMQTAPSPLPFLSEQAIIQWLQQDMIPACDAAKTFKITDVTFAYLSPFDMQAWLDCTVGVLIEMFKGKRVPCPNPRPIWGAYIQPYA